MDNGDLEVADNIEFAMKQNPEATVVKFIHPKHLEDDISSYYKTHGQILDSSTVTSFVPSVRNTIKSTSLA